MRKQEVSGLADVLLPGRILTPGAYLVELRHKSGKSSTYPPTRLKLAPSGE